MAATCFLMRKIFLVISCLFLVLILVAQDTGEITIKSKDSGQPAQSVEVYIQEMDTTIVGNAEGKTIIPLGELKKLTLNIFADGYRKRKKVADFSQESKVTIELIPLSVQLGEVEVKESRDAIESLRLKSVEGMSIYSAKKTEKIELKDLPANLSTNNSRQIYAKVSGLNIWESHGSGLNTEIGSRGLSPIRSSNFNMRQNGYDISADALGYPDAYYVPPAEAVQRIEVVRGAASLQYGTQFGGMINYKMKQPDRATPLAIELRQTAGTYGFFNSFNALGGTYKKLSYYNAFQYKRGNGWRENSGFHSYFNYAHLGFEATEKFNISFNYTYFSYLAQQPGGLTDAMFEQDHQQSIRDRNWFQVNWHLPQMELNYQINERSKIRNTTFALFAERDATGFLGNITRVDPEENRDLLHDEYKNVGNETRFMHKYRLKQNINVFLVGARLYRGFTIKQQGETDDGSGPSFDYNNPDRLEGSDYDFPSRNIALFAENIFHVTKDFSITPGVRFENILTEAEGYYRQTSTDLAGNILMDTLIYDNQQRNRSFVIAGIGISYSKNEALELYSNISQNYRAVNFNDLRIVNPNFRVDPNLEDERGFNTDIGIRGVFNDLLAYDVSLFYLNYNNRIGFVLQSDTVLFNTYRLRTNVSQSRSLGVETVIDIDWLRLSKNISKDFSLKTFVNGAYIDGRYVNSDEPAYENRYVELVPRVTLRSGLSFIWKDFSIGLQYSYTGEQYTDASNAEFAPDAVNGLIPAYYVMDANLKYTFKFVSVEANINNLTNNKYFTRRAAGYPGPGIVPADGITAYLTLIFNIRKRKSKEQPFITGFNAYRDR